MTKKQTWKNKVKLVVCFLLILAILPAMFVLTILGVFADSLVDFLDSAANSLGAWALK